MMQIQKKIKIGCELLYHFSMTQYNFSVKKIIELQNQLLPSERKEFEVFPDEMNFENYCFECIAGCRQFILKDSPDTIPAAIKRLRL